MIGDAAAEALLAPVRAVVEAGLRALGADVDVTVGAVDGFWRRDGDVVVLSHHLLGPDVCHPDERAELPLDRWRRAAASVLEAAVFTSGDAPLWARLGLAIDRADRAAPDLGLAAADLASAYATGDLGRNPRGGIAIVRAWRALGDDPEARVAAFVVDPAEWFALARRVLDPVAAAALPVPVARVRESDIPLALGPWSFRPLAVPEHPRGGLVIVEGAGVVDPTFARGKRAYRGLAATTTGARFLPGVGGPIGRWEFKTAQGFGQVFGSRGMSYVIEASGKLAIDLADGFVGPLSALDQAEKMGTSGRVTGVWMVDGPDALRFDRIDPSGIATHGRRLQDPVLPAEAFGMGPMLRALMDDTWVWSIDGDRLTLRGRVMGGPVEMRLTRL